MNYYIQGDAANADKIKAAFEKLGYDISWPEGCANPDVVNIGVERNGAKYVVAETSEYIKDIIKTHPDYKELELPVEPRYKAHDFVVSNGQPAIIYELKKDYYLGKYLNGHDFCHKYADEDKLHLWTIQDAEDGDVLNFNGFIFIFKGIDENNGVRYYCYYAPDNHEDEGEFGTPVVPGSIMGRAVSFDSGLQYRPATEKQRVLLFKKMQEAGYQWYAGKKELRKIIEPKFKIGDWITDGNITIQIENVRNDCYTYSDGVLYSTRTADEVYHLWSIADAKDGDILATDNGWTCIFKAFDGYVFSSYCFMDSQKWFCGVGSEAHTLDSRVNGNIHPATKEQCDLLFAKMKEAGYKWDEKKKELKKIPKHYDIANFHAGMPVLVRETSLNVWQYVLFSHCYTGGDGRTRFNAGLVGFNQCIPFNDRTKPLLGTNGKPPEEFINW